MSSFVFWMVVSTLLQLGHPALATVVPSIGSAAGLLGVGIPLVVGFLWARGDTVSGKMAFGRGFLLGWVPALIGLVLAFGLGQVNVMVLTLGGVSSGVAGGLGALVGGRGRS